MSFLDPVRRLLAVFATVKVSVCKYKPLAAEYRLRKFFGRRRTNFIDPGMISVMIRPFLHCMQVDTEGSRDA